MPIPHPRLPRCSPFLLLLPDRRDLEKFSIPPAGPARTGRLAFVFIKVLAHWVGDQPVVSATFNCPQSFFHLILLSMNRASLHCLPRLHLRELASQIFWSYLRREPFTIPASGSLWGPSTGLPPVLVSESVYFSWRTLVFRRPDPDPNLTSDRKTRLALNGLSISDSRVGSSKRQQENEAAAKLPAWLAASEYGGVP